MIDTPFGTVGTRRALDRVRADLARSNRQYDDRMVALEAPPDLIAAVNRGPAQIVRAWRSRDYLAALWQEPGKPVQRLSVNRTRIGDDGRWVDGITWDDLQRIKRECGFGDCEAVEIYPRDADVVDVANIRHLWLLPDGFPHTWR